MGARTVAECDECGREDVVGCIGGTHYYCTRHEDAVAEMHAADLDDDVQLTCDECGRIGNQDDGIEPGGPCQEPCEGTVRVYGPD